MRYNVHFPLQYISCILQEGRSVLKLARCTPHYTRSGHSQSSLKKRANRLTVLLHHRPERARPRPHSTAPCDKPRARGSRPSHAQLSSHSTRCHATRSTHAPGYSTCTTLLSSVPVPAVSLMPTTPSPSVQIYTTILPLLLKKNDATCSPP